MAVKKFRIYETGIAIDGNKQLIAANAAQFKTGIDAISAWITAQAASLGQPTTNLRAYAVRDEDNMLVFAIDEAPIA
jgi:hypothetical protein